MGDLNSFEEQCIPVTAIVSESRYKGSKGGSKSSKGGMKKGVWDSSRGGRGGMTVERRSVTISKTLSRLLRHQAKNAGIELDDEGFARVDKVVSFDLFNFPPRL
jgi:2'-phosphotransferase